MSIADILVDQLISIKNLFDTVDIMDYRDDYVRVFFRRFPSDRLGILRVYIDGDTAISRVGYTYLGSEVLEGEVEERYLVEDGDGVREMVDDLIGYFEGIYRR